MYKYKEYFVQTKDGWQSVGAVTATFDTSGVDPILQESFERNLRPIVVFLSPETAKRLGFAAPDLVQEEQRYVEFAPWHRWWSWGALTARVRLLWHSLTHHGHSMVTQTNDAEKQIRFGCSKCGQQ